MDLRNFGANQYLELRARLLEFGFLPPDEGDGIGGAGICEPRPPGSPPSLSAAAAPPGLPDESLGTLGDALLEALRGHGEGGEGGESAATRRPRPHPLPPLPPAAAPADEAL